MTNQPFTPRKPKGGADKAYKLYPAIHAKLAPYLRNDFFFLNIGANDGVSNDPIYPYLLIHPGWRGVAVEPVRHNFEQLAYNYRHFPNISLVNAAISEEKKAFYYVCENSGCDLTWVSQISSFDKNYILESLSDFREYGPEGLVTGDAEQHVLEDDSITCLSLDALVEEYAIEQIDFLNIDAEGSDFDIFRQFDFKRFTPTVICVENLGFNQAQREYFDTVMAEYQYKFISTFGIFSEIYARA